ncbi:uncharacterized protein [Dysidea avara]|uniref:uncharacterized protein isoform X2 n=1 Tax=Dysidea avara TaxID=196820 RepID=UPI00331E700D
MMASTEFSVTSIELDRFVLKDVEITNNRLGEGAYGRVFEVQYTGTTCAAKEIHSIFFQVATPHELERIKRSFLEECRIWSTLRHPNIVLFIGVWYRNGDDSGIPVIVMEKMHCSLRFFVETHGTQEIKYDIKLSILHDVSKGLWYLHTQNPPIIHRDLTPNNILLGRQCEAKITDLGVAKIMKDTDSGRKMTKVPGTPHFMPPETLDDKPKYGPTLDIFSYGGVILYTITQQWPEPKAREKHNPYTGRRELVSEVDRRNDYLDKMTGVAIALDPLTRSCLNDSPDERPSITEVSRTIKHMIDLAVRVPPGAYSQKSISTSTFMTKKIHWETLSPAPVSGAGHTAVLLDGLVYVGGGTEGIDAFSHYRIDIFDPYTNSWNPSPIQTSHCLFAMTVFQNQLIIVGGASCVEVRSGWFWSVKTKICTCTDELLCLDTATKQWVNYSQMITPRIAATAVSHEAMLVVVGGTDSDRKPLGNTELLDTMTNQWYVCNDIPQPYSWLKPVIAAGILYLMGGVSQDHNSPAVFATSLNTLTKNHNINWSFSQSTPWCRSCPVVINGSDILVIGGRQATIDAPRTSNIYMLNHATGTWDIIPSQIPEARSAPAAVIIGGNKILMIGGMKPILSLFHPNTADKSVVIGSFQ